MIKKLSFVVMLISLLAAFQIPDALACSGYAYFGVSDLPEMELLVRATVIDTDDRGYNAVIRVEEYYKGEGAQLLTVMRYHPALANGALVRGYDTRCLYAGRGHRWVQGSQGYFGLRSNGDGTFNDSYGGTAHFYVVDGMITYQEGATEGYALEFDEPLTITEEEFVAQLLEIGGRDEPLPPTTDNIIFYPLMRFLNITTEDGTRYQVNPDRSVLQLPEDAPIAISADGAHVAFRLDDDTLAFQYIWTTYSTDEYVNFPIEVDGEAVQFSNNSSFAAVWDHEQLSLYMIHNHQSTEFNYGQSMSLNLIAQTDLVRESDESLPQVMWSADSSTIVWEDNTGVWRWNIVNDAEPALMMSPAALEEHAYSFPALLDVSTHGRYVRVGGSDEWRLIDSLTMETYDNAVAAPKEQFLIYMGAVPGDEVENTSCTPPLRETCPVYVDSSANPDMTFPYQMNLLGIVDCQGGGQGCIVYGESWDPSIGDTQYVGGRYIGASISNIRQVAYDPQYRTPAILVGDYNVYFDFYSAYYVGDENYRPYLDILELEDILDSPIASIEWGQPVFYDEYHLTTNEHTP